jgi:hypothetical protein
MEPFRVDDYYPPGSRIKDYIYFGLSACEGRLCCVGGSVLSVLDLEGGVIVIGATRIDPARTASGIYRRVLQDRGGTEYDQASSLKVVDAATGAVRQTLTFDTHPEVYEVIGFPAA